MPYRYVWGAWARSLAPRAWHEAMPTDVLAFIRSAAPEKDKPSSVTQRRYWRILDRIYDFACLHGLASRNPAQEMAPADIPPYDAGQGAILSPRMWHALPKHLKVTTSATSARDAAIFYVLMECAASTAELLRLSIDDLAMNGPAVTAVRLTGDMPHHHREIAVSAAASNAITEWLAMRSMVGTSRLSRALFLGRDQPTLTSQALHKITAAHIQYTALIEGLPQPVRSGPQVFRNTAIVHWLLSGMSVQQALVLAGLKSPSSLDRLKEHLPLHVRQAIASSTPSEDND